MRTLLNVLLSVQLIFTPHYGFANSSNDAGSEEHDFFRNALQELLPSETVSDESPETQKIIQYLEGIGTAIEKGELDQHLKSLPPKMRNKMKETADILLLRDQEVNILGYKSKTDESAPIIDSIDFHQEIRQNHQYSMAVKNIHVNFDSDNYLIFEGVSVEGDASQHRERKVDAVHRFKGIHRADIVDWAYDKEMLVLLHKKKGLIVFHMVLAQMVLGRTPIPSARIIDPALLKNNRLNDLKLEFMDRYIEPLDKINHTQDMQRTIEGHQLFSAGDLLISHSQIDQDESNKYLLRHISRTKLKSALYYHYILLDGLLNLISVHMTSLEDTSLTEFYERNRDAKDILLSILFSLIQKESLSYLNHVFEKGDILMLKNTLTHGMQQTHGVHKPHSSITLEQWRSDYRKIVGSINESARNELESKGKPPISVDDVRAVLTGQDAEIVNNTMLKKFKDKLKKHLLEEGNIVNWLVAIVGFELVIRNISSINVANHTAVMDGVAYLTVLSVGVLLTVWGIFRTSIPVLKLVEKTLLKKDSQWKKSISVIIEKWENKSTTAQTIGSSFKALSILAVSPFKRFLQAMGKPHALLTAQKGVHSSANITPESSIWHYHQRMIEDVYTQNVRRTSGVKEGRRTPDVIKLRGGFHWRTNTPKYKLKETLIEELSKQNHKIDSLSRLIALYVLSDTPFDPSLIALSIEPLLDKEKIKYIIEHHKSTRQFVWVSAQLRKFINNSTHKIDITKPIFEWDSQIINEYYQEALRLYEQAQHMRFAVARTNTRQAMEYLNKFYVEKVLHFNEQEVARLKHYPSDFVEQIFWPQLVMDHLTLLSLPVLDFSPLGGSSIGVMYRHGMDHVAPFFIDLRFGTEIPINVVTHWIIIARNEAFHVGNKELIEKILNEGGVADLYSPLIQVPKHKQHPGRYLFEFAKYLFSGGKTEVNELHSEKDRTVRLDLGYNLFKWWMKYLKFAHVAFITLFTSRFVLDFVSEGAIGLTVLEQAMSSLLYISAGLLYFGGPTVMTTVYHSFMAKHIKKNKTQLESIFLQLHNIQNRLFASEPSLNAEYKRVLEDIRLILSSNPFILKKLKKLTHNEVGGLDFNIRHLLENSSHLSAREINDQLERIAQSHTIEDKIKQTESLHSLFTHTLKIPTAQPSAIGFGVLNLLFLGIYSNLAVGFLNFDAFTPDKLTLENIGTLFLLTNAIVGGLYIVHSKGLREWMKWLKERPTFVSELTKDKYNKWMEYREEKRDNGKQRRQWRKEHPVTLEGIKQNITDKCKQVFQSNKQAS